MNDPIYQYMDEVSLDTEDTSYSDSIDIPTYQD